MKKRLRWGVLVLFHIFNLNLFAGSDEIPDWLHGTWRIDQKSLGSELNRARNSDQQRFLGLVALSEAVATAEISFSRNQGQVRGINPGKASVIVQVQNQADGSVKVSVPPHQPAQIYNTDKGVYLTTEYGGEKINVQLSSVEAASESSGLPEWIEGAWILDNLATLDAYRKATIRIQAEPPAVLEHLRTPEARGSIKIAGNRVTVELFDEIETWQVSSVSSTERALEIKDSDGKNHIWELTPNRHRLMWRTSDEGLRLIFKRAPSP